MRTISALLQRECQQTTTITESSEHPCVRTARPFTNSAVSAVVYTAAHRLSYRAIGLGYRKVSHGNLTHLWPLKHVHDNYLPELVQQMTEEPARRCSSSSTTSCLGLPTPKTRLSQSQNGLAPICWRERRLSLLATMRPLFCGGLFASGVLFAAVARRERWRYATRRRTGSWPAGTGSSRCHS